MDELQALRSCLSSKRYGELRALLAGLGAVRLAGLWREFEPIEKLVQFKLLSPRKALELYAALDVDAKYFLLCAFELESIAPVLARLPPKTRGLFRRLPEAYYDRMLRALAREQTEIVVSVGTN